MNLKLVESKKDKQREKKNNAFELWKSQIANQNLDQTISTYHKLIKQIDDYDSNKRNDYDDLLNKLNYIEQKLGVKGKLGRELH